MAEVFLKFSISGKDITPSMAFEEAAEAISAIRTRISKMKTTLMIPIGRVIARQVKARFENAGVGPGDLPSDRWPNLKRVTIGARRYRGNWPGAGGRQPIRRETLRTQKSIGIFKGSGKRVLSFGTRIPHAIVQEFGDVTTKDVTVMVKTEDGRVYPVTIQAGAVIPARPVLEVNDYMVDQIETLIADYAMQRFDRLGEVGEQIVGKFGD